MTLENSLIHDLINLDTLLYNDNNTYEEWLEEIKNDEQIRKELFDSIKEKLESNNYGGPMIYHAMYWFTKGLRLPDPQQPKRYVDSDDYLFKNLQKFKV